MARSSAKQVGALWRHEKEGIGAFLTGSLDLGGLGEVPIAIFQNQRKKKGSKEPDYRIVLSERSVDQNLDEPDSAHPRPAGAAPAKSCDVATIHPV